MCPFVFFDGDFDLPKYLFTDFADCRTECMDYRRGVEVENTEKILVREIFVRIHPAPAHECIGDTDGRCTAEPCPDAVYIILLQKRICNDVDNFPMVVNPVFFREVGRHVFNLIAQVSVFCDIEAVFKGFSYDIRVFRVHLPQIHWTGVFAATCIRNIEYIMDFLRITGGINQCNAF
ncbi:MAG: hypothetical protein J6I42_09355 [Clostridia bacterium]|nr:hypothetical protein [Clostridia bacterium]